MSVGRVDVVMDTCDSRSSFLVAPACAEVPRAPGGDVADRTIERPGAGDKTAGGGDCESLPLVRRPCEGRRRRLCGRSQIPGGGGCLRGRGFEVARLVREV